LPLQVLAPLALDDAAAIVSILNPTGGLVGGDRLVVDVAVGAGAHACLTTPSATKVYRTAVGPAEQAVRLTLAPGARLEWVPDHTIPFARASPRSWTTAPRWAATTRRSAPGSCRGGARSCAVSPPTRPRWRGRSTASGRRPDAACSAGHRWRCASREPGPTTGGAIVTFRLHSGVFPCSA